VQAPVNYSRLTKALLTWAELQRELPAKQLKLPSWDPAYELVRSAESLDRFARQHLEDALAHSDAALSPLRDPLALNLGAHRWLSADREESYSDWLAWILQGMPGAAEILPLFGLGDDGMSHVLGPVEKVRREGLSPYGRTDIDVRFGKRGLLLIEVKVRLPGSDVVSQLRRYDRWAAKEPVERRLLVLLGAEEPRERIAPFTFTGWQSLCQRLRRYADRLKESDMLRAAAILIFCGAVEQNIFGLSVRPGRFRAMPTVTYLRGWRGEA
jgi:hypothetical protein